ncbi:hypothetical protein MYVA_2885 [Mycolicibacterium vaccae 95051]|nr:hypothetical protein MYVA_2885 [Mycolicibacterium vaccae 95051]
MVGVGDSDPLRSGEVAAGLRPRIGLLVSAFRSTGGAYLCRRGLISFARGGHEEPPCLGVDGAIPQYPLTNASNVGSPRS